MAFRPFARRLRHQLAVAALATVTVLAPVGLAGGVEVTVDGAVPESSVPTTATTASGASTSVESTGTTVATTTTVAASRIPTNDRDDDGTWVEVLASTPASGGAVGVRGGVFAPLSAVEIWFPDQDRRLATTTADLDGEVAANITLPATTPGSYEVRLVGTAPDGRIVDASTTVDVAEESVVREPVTGSPIASDALPILLVVIAVLGGLFLARRTARRVQRMEADQG